MSKIQKSESFQKIYIFFKLVFFWNSENDKIYIFLATKKVEAGALRPSSPAHPPPLGQLLAILPPPSPAVQPEVFYQLCRLSLVIPVLCLAIPGLSLAIPGLSLLVPFQYVPDSSCLMIYQQYINSSNKLNLLETMIWYIFQKISDQRELLVYVWTMSEKLSIKRKRKHWSEKSAC